MKLRENSLIRFLLFVLIPLIFIIYSGLNKGNYYADLICLFGINTILAASLILINGFSGMFSMGHAAFMAIGAYVSALLTISVEQKERIKGLPQWFCELNVPFPIALILAGVFAMIVALIIGYPVLRLKNHYLSVVTLGLIVIVKAVLDNASDFTNGARGITGLPSYANAWTIFGVAIFALYIMYRVVCKSAYGRGLIAMREDDVAAQALGINLTVKKISIFCLSAFIAGVGGALWGHLQTVIAGQFFYFDESFAIVETVIIGGSFALSGSIVGALIMTVLPQLLAPLETGIVVFGIQLPELYGISNIVMSVLLIILIIFRRQGIMGNSEIIIKSIFSKDTYLGLFKKETYTSLVHFSRNK